MKLSRIAAIRADQEYVAFSDKKPDISIELTSGEITMVVKSAGGMGPKGSYNYKICVSPDDLYLILEKISESPLIYKKSKIRDAIEKSSLPLMRLIAACGLPSSHIPQIDRNDILNSLKEKLSK
ncbi:hypothetical protein [Leptothrix ochracea]|uniref:hypothetical protein n=1 Tax=Leptothrix ochracea TaxID=735331 RepID=UPI0034E21073